MRAIKTAFLKSVELIGPGNAIGVIGEPGLQPGEVSSVESWQTFGGVVRLIVRGYVERKHLPVN